VSGELPKGWAEVIANDLGEWRGGGTPSKANKNYWNDGSIPWVSPKDMKCNVITDTEDHITEAAVQGSATQLIPSNSVLVVTRSGILRHSLPVAVNSQDVTINQDLKALTPYQGIVAEFIAGQFRADASDILSNCAKSGTTVDSVDFDKFKARAFRLAPTSEQHRIVAKIDSLFARSSRARDELAHIPKLIERYRQAVLEAAFRGDLTADWRAKSDFVGRSAATAIRNERRNWWEKTQGSVKQYVPPSACSVHNLYKIPTSWDWLRAEEVCAFITKGTTPSKQNMTSGIGDIPYIKVYNLTFSGKLDFSIAPTFVGRATHEGELARSRVIAGDVLMNIVGPPLGKVSIVPDSYPEWNVNQAIAIFRPMPSIDRRYLSYWLSSPFSTKWSVSRSKATAGQSNLTLEICRNIPIPIPPLDEQIKIVSAIDRHCNVLKNCSEELSFVERRLTKLDQSILDKAFTGQLVPQDPNDEPASKLPPAVKRGRKAKGAADGGLF